MSVKDAFLNQTTGLSEKIKGLSKHEAWAVAKPWIESAARTAGIKSLYDVPEYFREKFELKGLKIGSKEFGGGLAQTTTELLEANQQVRNNNDVSDRPNRNKLFDRLTELEEGGQADSLEYREIEKQLDASQSTAVRDSIAKLNNKLALTKEGGQKHSEARKEMARLLREQRNEEKIDRQAVKGEVTTLLNDYTNQKVDGVTAARESLRTALMVSGTQGVMTAANIGLDAIALVKQTAQEARRDGEKVSAKALADRFAKQARSNWSKLKNGGEGSNNTSNRWKDRAAVVAQMAQSASKYGVGGGGSTSIAKLTEQVLDKSNPKFRNQPTRSFETPEIRGLDANKNNYRSTSTPTIKNEPVVPKSESTSKKHEGSPNYTSTKKTSKPPLNYKPSTAAATPIYNAKTLNKENLPNTEEKVENDPKYTNKASLSKRGSKKFGASQGRRFLKEKIAPYKEVFTSTPAVRQYEMDKKRADDPVFYNKRKGSERTDLLPQNKKIADKTRNVKYTSNMPGAPGERKKINEAQGNPHKTTSALRNEEIESSGVGSEYRGGKETKKKEVEKSGVRDIKTEGQSPKSMGLVRPGVQTISRRRNLRKKLGKKSLTARLRAGAANTMISAWGIPLWLTFQIPFAVLNILFFSAMAAVSSLMTTKPDDWLVLKALKSIFQGFVKLLSWSADVINSTVGWDLSGINPGSFWALTEMVMFGYTVMIIFLMYIQYKVFFLNPLSGKGEAAKYGAVMLMIFCYLFPIVNLFPWFGVWAIIVWIHPK